MATLISPFKKLIFLISFVILLTGIFFGFVSIQNCVLNYNPPKTKSQIEQLVKKSADSSKTRFVSDDKHYQRTVSYTHLDVYKRQDKNRKDENNP